MSEETAAEACVDVDKPPPRLPTSAREEEIRKWQVNADVNYLPVQYREREQCVRKWVQTRQLGKGCFGSVHEACRADQSEDCDYVLKVSDVSTQPRYESFNRDAHFVKLLSQLPLKEKISPKFYDAWICNEIGYLVTEKMSGNLETFFKTDKNEAGQKILTMPQWAFDGSVAVLNKLSDQQIVHGDVKEDNFLYTESDKKVYLTDFGNAVDYGRGIPKKHQLGWHYSRLACRTLSDFVHAYNLWNWETRLRALLKVGNYTGGFWVVAEDGTKTQFKGFASITSEQRKKLEASCVLKFAFV